jgi:flavin reductase (DIM6/NTAB) family NADH-FMN oxidoreductase RutF
MKVPLKLSEVASEALKMAENGGVLLSSIGNKNKANLMTIGWLLFGRSYHKHPVSVIAVRPATYTYKLLDQISEYVISVPTSGLREAVDLCGTTSGRDVDKFKTTGLTAIKSEHVTPFSIKECPINIECRIYHKERPPHMLLTPEHRMKPVKDQHTIYFSEVLGAFQTC